jgi:hypothetical protein
MTERPILFNAEMVRAILDGCKTQTRRNIKYTTEHRGPINPAYLEAHKDHPGWKDICPYGQLGETLWVPETDPTITLRITDIRVERLQDISVADAKAEGCKSPLTGAEAPAAGPGVFLADERTSFAILWNKINGHGAWNENPWVWVISFKRIKP